MEMNYNIPGFKISKMELSEMPEFGFIEYKALFCKFSIAKDDMGTQICENGNFFGPWDFKNIDDAVNWLKEDSGRYESAKRVFTKVWFKGWKYTLSNRYFDYLVWKCIHKIFPNYYLNNNFSRFINKFVTIAILVILLVTALYL